jgi:hypothetical protein
MKTAATMNISAMQSFRYGGGCCCFLLLLLCYCVFFFFAVLFPIIQLPFNFRLTTYRDYLQLCAPGLWGEKTQTSFLNLIELIVSANPTTVDKALTPEVEKIESNRKEPTSNQFYKSRE